MSDGSKCPLMTHHDSSFFKTVMESGETLDSESLFQIATEASNEHLDGVHFRCATQDLRHQWTDLDETLRVYRVDPDIMQRHIFDFRSRPENRK